jgi:predicted benzoate:H+ symporter BenE
MAGTEAAAPAQTFAGNRYDRSEWAGAFGDLGTLIPFLVAYTSLLKVDPFGLLLAFGVAMIVVGLYYRTPFPVQPMKGIGAVATTQAAQTIVITPGAVYGAGLVTGLVWLILGLTGAAKKVADLVSRRVAVGIIMGLGFAFMLEGTRMMAQGWLLAAIALAGTLLLLTNRVIPVMFLLLVFGAAAAVVEDPALIDQLARVHIELRVPDFPLFRVTWEEIVIGTLFLALPQVPLTLGNAIIAITDENNRLFPDRTVNERKVALSTGVMNLAAAPIGGVPMCHGAGGMAGHVRFGARTGGAPVILGTILVLLALFVSGSIDTLFRIFPSPILGVILFLTGAQLALGSCDFGETKNARFITLVTAGCAVWNVGIAFLVGIACDLIDRKGWLRL